MVLRYSIRNILLVILAAFILSACAAKTTTKKIETQITNIFILFTYFLFTCVH